MKSNKLCVLISHFYVRRYEDYKFDVLKYVLEHYRKQNSFIILSAHGELKLPNDVVELIDDLYWEEQIDNREIGRGHPKFCIKGYELAMKNGFSTILKHRAEDLILHENVKQFLDLKLGDKKLIISEQTSFDRRLMGDLFHYGSVEYMYNLWAYREWDYNYDGLKNLFANTVLFNNNDPEKITKSILFSPVVAVKWVSVTDCWNYMTKSPKHLEHSFWGKNRYQYYGG